MAARYYVRMDGHDTASGANDNSNASTGAFRTVQRGLDVAKTTGDVVTVHTGNYEGEDLLLSKAAGSVGNLITVQAATGETVTVKRIYVSHDYVKINALRFTYKGGLASDPIIRVGTISAYGQAKKNGVEIVNSTISGGNTATYALTFVGDNGIISGNTFDGGTEYYGHHDGVNGSATLTDATQNWTPNSLVGKTVENIYDCGGSSGTITANTATSVTATLIGGSRQSWTNTSISSDRYVIGGSFFVGIYSEGNDITISNNTFRNAAHIERVFEPSGNRTTFSGNEIYGMNASYAGTSPCGSHVDIWQLGGVALSKDHLIEKKYIHDNASCQIIHGVINNAA